MLKITATLDEINANDKTEIGSMIESFAQFIRDQFDFDIDTDLIEFDLPNNEISVPVEVI